MSHLEMGPLFSRHAGFLQQKVPHRHRIIGRIMWPPLPLHRHLESRSGEAVNPHDQKTSPFALLSPELSLLPEKACKSFAGTQLSGRQIRCRDPLAKIMYD